VPPPGRAGTAVRWVAWPLGVALDGPDLDPRSFRRTFVAPQFTGELAFSLTVFDGARRARDEVVVTVVEQVFFVELGDGFTVQPGARVELEADVIGATARSPKT
jgi:hypothetical protein